MTRAMSVFDIAGRAMSAQLVRLNTTASNLANAGSVSATRDGAFRALRPGFEFTDERIEGNRAFRIADGHRFDQRIGILRQIAERH